MRTKHAGWLDSLKRSIKENPTPYVVAASASAPFIGEKIQQGISGIANARNKAKAYKNLLDENPDLQEYSSRDTQRLYNTLHRTAPELAEDPIVAGTWIRQQFSSHMPDAPFGGVIKGVQDAASIRRDMMQSRRRGPGMGFELGKNVGEGIRQQHGAQQELDETQQAFNEYKQRQSRKDVTQQMHRARERLQDIAKQRGMSEQEAYRYGDDEGEKKSSLNPLLSAIRRHV